MQSYRQFYQTQVNWVDLLPLEFYFPAPLLTLVMPRAAYHSELLWRAPTIV
jgi:hypothetical protein